ncbi:hypothetical protein [Alcaligenes aquatilis]|uniref:hypothetical protein n=1 Tax=Alcaligenes aquatilis TaxID=323284 RepID=UPI0038731EAC
MGSNPASRAIFSKKAISSEMAFLLSTRISGGKKIHYTAERRSCLHPQQQQQQQQQQQHEQD